MILTWLIFVAASAVTGDSHPMGRTHLPGRKTTIHYLGNNSYKLHNACILPKGAGLGVSLDFASQVLSVSQCGALFFRNEYGIRQVKLSLLSGFENREFETVPAHFVTSSSLTSFWHLLHSVIPAYEMSQSAYSRRHYFSAENGAARCGKGISSIREFKVPKGQNLTRTLWRRAHDIFEILTNPFRDRVHAPSKLDIVCHEEIIVGQPPMFATSKYEWDKQFYQKHKKLLRIDPLAHENVRHLRAMRAVDSGAQRRYAAALLSGNLLLPCSCSMKPRFVLVKRTHSRRILNSDDLTKSSEDFANVTHVALENLSAREQLKLVACADIFVGMSGSGMTWMVFMRELRAVIIMQYRPSAAALRMEWKGSPNRRTSGIFIPEHGMYTEFGVRGNLHVQAWEAYTFPSSTTTQKTKSVDVVVDLDDFRTLTRNAVAHLDKYSLLGGCTQRYGADQF
mmetsp:Transcript_11740/g.24613  ORF Transcript_11740/g.24613 Transcript_11740/m.24613 type:complete len:452 (-) Transcript_11740:1087-2442(-)|eukprot:CAMPEP_0118945904 /NCGR_PEP_ID=MMETSP1169-20130426/43199_1 /TAXON_ID=36882 /ORGANISM="Pyramimonas obovata, Strain CCMP722" /LENGTH=451 /DNA_ID=CAMNT_0006891735 /DNA_START=109 /DNA_END=1464 /DNA_ORIENTATION=+